MVQAEPGQVEILDRTVANPRIEGRPGAVVVGKALEGVEDVVLIGTEGDGQTIGQRALRPQVLAAVAPVAVAAETAGPGGSDVELLGQGGSRAEFPFKTVDGFRRGVMQAPEGGVRRVVVDHQRAVAGRAVAEGIDVFVDTVAGLEVVELEIGDPGEVAAAVQQREDLPFVVSDERLVRRFVPVGAAVLHAVLLAVPLDLAVAEHRQPRQGGKQHRHAEVLVAHAELLDGGRLVGVVHEVDVALENLRVEGQDVLEDTPVLGVLLLLEQVHEGAVVDPVHPQRPDKVALHQPESFGDQQGVGDLGVDAVDHLAPELDGEDPVEFSILHPEGRARRYPGAPPGRREPQAPEVLARQGHGRVETNQAETAGGGDDQVAHRLSDLREEEVELGGVVPRHVGAVVAVVQVAAPAAVVVDMLEDYGSVAVIPVAVLDAQADGRVFTQVRTGEVIGRIGGGITLDEPVGMLVHPLGIDAGMVGDHVAGQADAAPGAAGLEVGQRRLAAQFRGDPVGMQGVG